MPKDHLDELTKWWDRAEVPTTATMPRDGDRIIIRYNPEWYEVATAVGDAYESDVDHTLRILRRGSKPYQPARYEASSELTEAVPLIKAKVTDGMVLRALNKSFGLLRDDLALYDDSDVADMRDVITAAIGMSAE